MAITVVQHKTGNTGAAGATVTCTMTSTGSGNLIVVGTGANNSHHVTGVTDNIGNVYVHVPGAEASHTGGASLTDMWYCASATAGVTLITVTFDASATYNRDVWAWEVNGYTAPIVDVAGVLNNGSGVGNVETGPAVVTTSTAGFIAAVMVLGSSVDINPNTGNEFTSGGDLSASNDAGCSLLSTTAASHQPAWHSVAGAPAFCSSVVALKEGGTTYAVSIRP